MTSVFRNVRCFNVARANTIFLSFKHLLLIILMVRVCVGEAQTLFRHIFNNQELFFFRSREVTTGPTLPFDWLVLVFFIGWDWSGLCINSGLVRVRVKILK